MISSCVKPFILNIILWQDSQSARILSTVPRPGSPSSQDITSANYIILPLPILWRSRADSSLVPVYWAPAMAWRVNTSPLQLVTGRSDDVSTPLQPVMP